MEELVGYKGPALTLEQRILQECFEESGGRFVPTTRGRNPKEILTLRLIKNGRNYGYINRTVNGKKVNGLMGYRSKDDGTVGFRDHCLKADVIKAEAQFIKDYGSRTGWKRNPESGPRKWKGKAYGYYLVITDPALAAKVCECEKEYKKHCK